MQIYYYDQDGQYSGRGESATLPPAGATDIEPKNNTDIFNGVEWMPSATSTPKKLSRAQARGALILAGLIDHVQPALDAIEDPLQRALAQNDWDNRLEFERTHPQLLAIAGALGLTDEQIDELFVTGATL